MKHIVSFLGAAAVIAAVYMYQFGVPFFVTAPSGTAEQQISGADGQTKNGTVNRLGGANSSVAPGGGPLNRRPAGLRRPQDEIYVTTADVVIQPYSDTYSAIGTGVAQNSVSLVAEVSGQIREVYIAGTPSVSTGDILIQLNDTNERINVEIAQANLDKAQDSLNRYLTLQKANRGIVPEVTIKEAEATVAVARGNLALAEETLDARAIRSPIDGKLGLSDWETGDYLSNGDTIVDLNNTETILVSFELPERAISVLALEKPVLATVPSMPGHIFEGNVIAFNNVIDTETRTITVKAAIDNENGRLWPGMTFTVCFAEESEPLASIPAMAMTWTRDGTQVWVEDAGQVQPVKVHFRKRNDDTIWVEGALEDGMRVVVDGVQKLRPGANVIVAGGTSPAKTGVIVENRSVNRAERRQRDSKPHATATHSAPDQKMGAETTL